MIIPRRPKDPVRTRGKQPRPNGATEPFVRLATLAPARERAGASPATYEERAGALIRRTAAPEALDRQSLDRLWGRLTRRPADLRGWRPSGSPRRWVLVTALLLLSTSGIVAAETGVWVWPKELVRKFTGRGLGASASPVVVPHPLDFHKNAGASTGAGAGRRIASSAMPPDDVPNDAEMPDAPSSIPPPANVRRGAEHPHRAPGQFPADPAAIGPSRLSPPSGVPAGRATDLAAESAVLTRALAHLRQARDPAAALRELDEYAVRFPSGTLAREAQSARIDALLASGRRAEARTALTGVAFGTGARDIELRLIRAELSAESSCASAIPDYAIVLADGRSPALSERALWGRAVCRSRLGDETRARADLAAYLARFPDGARAAAARTRLAN